MSTTRSRSPQRISHNRSTSQDSSSPYSKPYHSYRTAERRRNEEMSAKINTRLGSEERPKSATHHEPVRVSAQERRNSAQEVYTNDNRRLPQTGTQSPTKRSERRSSSNGDIGKVDKKNETNIIEGKSLKLSLEELEDGEIDESNGLPSSTDANVSEVSAGNGERVASPVGSHTSSISSTNVQVQEALSRANKGSARKGFLRGVVTTEQHDKQTKLLNAVRANSKVASNSGQLSSAESPSPTIMTRIHTRKGLPNEVNSSSSDRARKTFVMPLPPEKTSHPELNSSQDESSSHSTSTPGTPSKRKKRYYKGGTYGLFLSKKRKKIKEKESKKFKETESNADTQVNPEGEESSQSFAANSESDGELESSISSNADNIDEQEANQNEEQEIVVNEDLIDEYVEEVSQEEVVNDCDEIPLVNEENDNIELPEVSDERKKTLEESEIAKNGDPELGSPKRDTNTQSSSSSIIDSVKNRPRSKRKVDGEEVVGCLSPTSSNPPKSKPEETKQSSPPTTAVPSLASNGELPKVSNGSPVRDFKMPSNSATLSVVQNPNRRTLLRISTAGSVESGDTHGTYLGVEQSKFIMINDKTVTQSPTCLCIAKPISTSSEISKGKPMFCQAIDCFDEKLIGCCNQIRSTDLFRSSKRVPYRTLCEVHLARLRRHHCCPGCGLFCTQGEFLECFCIKKQIHLFHKKCQIEKPQDPKSQHCLHCDNVSVARSVRLEMNGPLNNNTYYFQQTSMFKTPKARISMLRKKGKQIDRVLEEFEEPGIEYTIPATKKVLSLAGLPLGPPRKHLEELLTTISADKQSPNIRLTIQHNKNFYAVAKSGEIDKVLSILAQGFDPNFPFEDNDNETPLHAAASCGHLLVVHLLIQSGANPNVLNKNMTTPIMQAIENKHNSVVKYLINAGASLDIRGEDGMTSLHIAAKSGNIEAVHYVINAGKMDVNLQDDGGWSALVWATEHKHYNIVKLLVCKGADPNIEDDEENIGLHWAAFSGETNIALMFLEMGSNVINQTNVHGDTPLHIASRRDNYDCVVLLLSRGADISLMNKNNESPLQCAPKDTQSAMALRVNQELKRYSIKCTLNSEKLLHRDLSKGKEYYQIQVVNGVDNEPYPIDFMYVTENCEASQINIDRTITSLQSCQCEDDCTSQKCVCSAISFRCWYDKEGKLLPEFNLMDAPMIFECNRACSCWKTCNNRVVQYGVRSRLQVFRTKGKGWGVRALRDIPRGTFVCEYVGEIISDSEADRREDDSYLFDLDNKDGETYCLDARFYGNICRFINHLCSPNLIPVKVFVDHQDLSFPRIALFSSRDIKAFEELGFDYGEKFWVIKYKWFTCSCGSINCKYNKESIHQTIDNYYKRLRDDLYLNPTPPESVIENI